jgi:competence protein ComFC
MLDTLNKIKEGIIDVLMPKKCLGCGREGSYICENCEIFLSEADPANSTCEVNATTSQVNGLISVWEYEGIIEKAIQKIKYEGCYDIINELIDKAFGKIELNLSKDTIVTYVPMYKKRERYRGFNQAKLIAEKMEEKTGKPVVAFLEKTKDNKSQVGLGPKEREENVKGVFRSTCEVNATTSQVNNVLLIDDVYTTGATMNECIKVLKKAGFKNVWGFTLSRKMSIQNY